MMYFNPLDMNISKYLFFTGKGGVGKTSTACAVAVNLLRFRQEGTTYKYRPSIKSSRCIWKGFDK